MKPVDALIVAVLAATMVGAWLHRQLARL